MSKGHVRDFVGLYAAILKDCSMYHPTLIADFERDLSRLKATVKSRGETLFLLDLPAMGKILDHALDEGVLPLMSIPMSHRINTRTTIPRLFQGLWLRIFSRDGCLKADVDSLDISLLRTLLYAGQKFRKECPAKATFKAVAEFFDVESKLPPPSLHWDGDGSTLRGSNLGSITDLSLLVPGEEDALRKEPLVSDRSLSVLQLVADRISGAIGDYVPSDYRFKHGPGAVSDLRSGNRYKYQFPSWGPRLQYVFPAEVFALANTSVLGFDYDVAAMLPLREEHSRLLAVPKTQKGPRLIAAEPTCHQWCQQNVRDFLTTRIGETALGISIDLSRQDLSGELARTASLTKSHATLDLSSASDRLSCFVVQRLFRGNIPLLEAMVATRTRYLQQTIDQKFPLVTKLRKFSSMGSALTFPVQSVVFAMICYAAGFHFCGLKVTDRNMRLIAQQVRVYGDDLIVPVSWVPTVEALLTKCLLKVNRAKSFSVGNFRESCGTDAFGGHIVNPTRILEFYRESAPSSVISVVQVSNNFYLRGFWNTAQHLIDQLPAKIRKLIPFVRIDDETFGLVTGSGFRSDSRKRFNSDLQRWEYVTFGTKVPKPTTRVEGFCNLLQFFTELPTDSQLNDWQSGQVQSQVPVLTRRWVAA